MPERVALVRASANEPASIRTGVFQALEAAGLPLRPGMRILVKPNLLTAVPLACTTPAVVAAACEWLLDQGAHPVICDSPAFGSARAVARAIGLSDALKPLGLEARDFGKVRKVRLPLPRQKREIRLGIASEALEADLILSAPRVKAHSQLRVTLAVKNCYGVICGLRKAIIHARYGSSLELFCDCVAALFASLPPVAGLCDGITAMSKTGPIRGAPFQLNLIAASASAPAADAALLRVLNLPASASPLCQALIRAGLWPDAPDFPLLRPEDFSAPGFETPATLKDISFNPLYLAKSLLKRVLLAARG
ncbi:MAG: DUF362 domain-containing protein [Desulfovibrio sp.]|nr:DUF362 domain-containing protein [Desulfovibrio sp.]